LANSIDLIENILQKNLINSMLCIYNKIDLEFETFIQKYILKKFSNKRIMFVNWKSNYDFELDRNIGHNTK
jgi:hypothetical protein